MVLRSHAVWAAQSASALAAGGRTSPSSGNRALPGSPWGHSSLGSLPVGLQWVCGFGCELASLLSPAEVLCPPGQPQDEHFT